MSAQYFAQLNNENIVIDVHCVTQQFLDADPERYKGAWVETFYDIAGKQYAGLGMFYDETLENFIPIVEPEPPTPSAPEPVEP